jgi:hypothetical protein
MSIEKDAICNAHYKSNFSLFGSISSIHEAALFADSRDLRPVPFDNEIAAKLPKSALL